MSTEALDNFKKQFAKELNNLEINDVENLSEKFISKKFKRKALKVHSDKTRKDDEEFKELLNDYRKLIKGFKDFNIEKEDTEKDDLIKFFDNHNFAKEFSQSWTVFIEKGLVSSWMKEMDIRYPDSREIQCNGRQYKGVIEGKMVYTTLYNVDIPKMNIQGNHSSIRQFVLNCLPDIYKAVHKKYQDGVIENTKIPMNARIKLAADTTYKCDICGKTYVRKPLFRKHIQTKHAETISAPGDMYQSIERDPPEILVLKGPNDNDGDLRDDGESVTLEEASFMVIEEIGPQNIEENWQCGECGETYNKTEELNEHMEKEHRQYEEHDILCEECGHSCNTNEQLKTHIENKHGENMWICVDCCETFASNEQRKTHVEAKHKNIELGYQCGDCEASFSSDEQLKTHKEDKEKQRKVEKELETLQRRHEQLKQKYDNINKDNIKYSKNLFEALQENEILKETIKKDAETLQDTLNMNQVLIEEIKVKDLIIKANEKINLSDANNETNLIQSSEDAVRPEEDDRSEIRCSICDYKTKNTAQLHEHMMKHKGGQNNCGQRSVRQNTKENMNVHVKEPHKKQTDVNEIKCNFCDKLFTSEHSLKQHRTSKHRGSIDVPVGHAEYQAYNRTNTSNTNKVKCGQCGKGFSNGTGIDEHLAEHQEEAENGNFQNFQKPIICRYFRRGACTKGMQCKFSHTNLNPQKQSIPLCRKGDDCVFFKQNRCAFFHTGVGVQKEFGQKIYQSRQKRECRYKNDCWRISTCFFSHPTQGFRFAHKTQEPPIAKRQIKVWMD